MSWTARALHEHVGCEIRDMDVRRLSRAQGLSDVEALIYRHHVLVFRNQDLSPQELLDFTRLFGEIDGSHVQTDFTLPGYPDIFVISNTEENGKPLGTKTVGHHWHTDWAYKAFPAAYTFLHGVEVPAKPHHTLFASQRRVYEQLGNSEKAFLRGRTGTYLYAKTNNAKTFYPKLTNEQERKTPPAIHPLMRVHPGTGKECLYLSRADCIAVSGMEEAAGLALVNELVERMVDSAHVYAHPWEQGDIVMWDNRMVLHSATPFDMEAHRRRIHRTTVKGEQPIPSTMSPGIAA